MVRGPAKPRTIAKSLFRKARSAYRSRVRHPALGRPASRSWGFDRGTPIDRHYIEGFLEENRHDIGGHVLEIRDDGYTRRFGTGAEKVSILDIDAANPRATIVGDLGDPAALPQDTFDCIICTQTLLLVWDVRSAVSSMQRSLRPGGVLLLTVPGLSRRFPEDGHDGVDLWRFTSAGLERLLAEAFLPGGTVDVRSHGNVLTASAFLYGLAVEELRAADLRRRDPAYEVLLTARAARGM